MTQNQIVGEQVMIERKTVIREIEIHHNDTCAFSAEYKVYIEKNVIEDGAIHCNNTLSIKHKGVTIPLDTAEARSLIKALSQLLKGA